MLELPLFLLLDLGGMEGTETQPGKCSREYIHSMEMAC